MDEAGAAFTKRDFLGPKVQVGTTPGPLGVQSKKLRPRAQEYLGAKQGPGRSGLSCHKIQSQGEPPEPPVSKRETELNKAARNSLILQRLASRPAPPWAWAVCAQVHIALIGRHCKNKMDDAFYLYLS